METEATLRLPINLLGIVDVDDVDGRITAISSSLIVTGRLPPAHRKCTNNDRVSLRRVRTLVCSGRFCFHACPVAVADSMLPSIRAKAWNTRE